VRDAADVPVAGVPLWCGGFPGVSRLTESAADGSFAFRRLPPAPEGESYVVSTIGAPDESETWHAALPDLAAPATGLVFRVERIAKLTLRVRDAATGAALPLFNVALERERIVDGEARNEPLHHATLHEEDGAWTTRVPRGEMTLFVEAPDHVPFHGAVTVPAEEGEWEVVIEMRK
jgi:hypothetical protein